MTISTKKFQTRTILKDRKNPSSEKYWPVALDIGYSAVKGFSPNRIFSFPAYASKIHGTLLDFAAAKPDEILYRDERGETWYVGASAQSMIESKKYSESELSLFGRHRYLSPMFLVIARVGIALSMLENSFGSPEEKSIFLQTGLPPAYMKEDAKVLREVLTGMHQFQIKVGGGKWTSIKFTLTKDSIGVMPQPMGTLFSISTDKNGSFTPEANQYLTSNLMILDPGFGTLDIFNIEDRHVTSSETYDNLGMKRVLEETSKEIYNEYGEDIPVPSMQGILGTGKVKVFDPAQRKNILKPFDVLLEKSSKKICQEVINKLDVNYGYLKGYDYLVVTGGTGAAWSEQIRESYGGILPIIAGNQNDDLPYIFSNVRGYYMYLLGKLNQ